MKLYLLFGLRKDDTIFDGDDFKYFYGCFSSEEKANVIRKNLEENPYGDDEERFEIEEYVLDEPADLYYFMMEE